MLPSTGGDPALPGCSGRVWLGARQCSGGEGESGRGVWQHGLVLEADASCMTCSYRPSASWKSCRVMLAGAGRVEVVPDTIVSLSLSSRRLAELTGQRPLLPSGGSHRRVEALELAQCRLRCATLLSNNNNNNKHGQRGKCSARRLSECRPVKIRRPCVTISTPSIGEPADFPLDCKTRERKRTACC